MDYKTFTTNLANLKRYRQSEIALKDELDQILYALSGVRGVSYDQVMVHGNPSQKALNWLKLQDKYNAKEEELKFIQSAIRQVESVLSRMPENIQKMLIEVFCDGHTYRYVGEKYGYSDHGVWQMMKRETEKYL